MVSDEAIVARLETLLQQADFSTTTISAIRQQLESEFGVALSEKAAFIRHHIDLYLQQHSQILTPPQDDSFPPPDMEVKLEEAGNEESSACESGRMEAKTKNVDSRGLKEPAGELMKESMPTEGRKRGRPGGLNKVCGVSPELQAVVGEATMPRTQIVKQLWTYIREKNLQDPSNKRNIICDDALRLVFDTDSTDMFQMNKLLARHIRALDATDDGSEPNAKKTTKGNTEAFLAPVPISDALAVFFGTGEIEMPCGEAVKRLWDYIKEKQLEDHSDGAPIESFRNGDDLLPLQWRLPHSLNPIRVPIEHQKRKGFNRLQGTGKFLRHWKMMPLEICVVEFFKRFYFPQICTVLVLDACFVCCLHGQVFRCLSRGLFKRVTGDFLFPLSNRCYGV